MQGWLKGVNSDMVDPTKDMGRDGDYTLGGNININSARDVFGYSLGYFEGDYYSINNVSAGGNHFLAEVSSGSDLLNARNDLYNGNISHMVTSITQPGTTTVLPYGYAYQYDQLNRLLHMEGYNNLDFPTNTWKVGGYTGAYETSLTYDANGNILTLNRNGEAGNTNMDNLTYQYDWVNNNPAQGLRSNKLYHVNDAITSTYTSDIDDQGSFTPSSSVNDINTLNNYGYDELGNLIRDDAEGIANIEWTVYGKIKSITRSASSTASNLSFKYDAGGKRIEKRETPYGGGADKVTYYVYDAAGNLMATYSRHLRDDANNQYDNEEMFICNSHIIYGSSRIGIDGRQDTLVGSLIDPIPAGHHTRLLGSKQYENSNHLGNVLVTISDIKIPHDYNANSVVDYYTADIISAQDYYPFGSIMPGRNWSNEEYRFGFNGKEKDNEVKGEGNSLDFGARIYDSRLGRFLSNDPLFKDYPYYTPYLFAGNGPLWKIDFEGKNEVVITTKNTITHSYKQTKVVGLTQEAASYRGVDVVSQTFQKTETYKDAEGNITMTIFYSTTVTVEINEEGEVSTPIVSHRSTMITQNNWPQTSLPKEPNKTVALTETSTALQAVVNDVATKKKANDGMSPIQTEAIDNADANYYIQLGGNAEAIIGVGTAFASLTGAIPEGFSKIGTAAGFVLAGIGFTTQYLSYEEDPNKITNTYQKTTTTTTKESHVSTEPDIKE